MILGTARFYCMVLGLAPISTTIGALTPAAGPLAPPSQLQALPAYAAAPASVPLPPSI